MTNEKINNYRVLIERFFSDTISEEELSLLRQWYCDETKKDEIKSLYWDKWCASSDDMDIEVQTQVWQNLQKVLEEKEPMEDKAKVISPHRHRIYLWMRYAALFLLPFMGGIFTYYFFVAKGSSVLPMKDMEVIVERGQKAKVSLPDGTSVWMNSDTKLKYAADFNYKDRVIELDGEAFFDVAKNKEKPFVVKANDLEVQALGTQFNVKAYSTDNQLVTSLIEGMVAVRDKKETVILNPNEMADFYKFDNKIVKNRIEDVDLVLAWRANELAFDGENLEEIATILERLYNINIVFESPKLKKIRFSGKIKNNNLENVFQLINLVAPISYIVKDSVVILRDRKN